MVIGVSDEAESLLEDYVNDKQPAFPIVRARGARNDYGVQGYPNFYTIGADGVILTTPEDRIPDGDTIEEALRSVRTVPDMPKGTRYDRLRRFYEKKDFKKYRDNLAKLVAEENLVAADREVIEQLAAAFDEDMKKQSARVEKYAVDEDAYRGHKRLSGLAKRYAGLPPGDAASAALQKFKTDKHLKAEVSAGKMLDKLIRRYPKSKSSNRRKLEKALIDFSLKYRSTMAGKRAKQILRNLPTN